MPRTISATVQSLIADGQVQHACHLLTFAVGENSYRFSDGDLIVHVGNSYTPHLRVPEGPRYSEELRNNPVRVELQNITLETAALLKADGAAAQGVEATLERLYLAARETVVLFVGRIGEIVVTEQSAVITLAGDLDPLAATVPRRKYSPLCTWDYKSAECGSASALTTCGKTLEHCRERGVPQNFNGFIYISNDLTVAIEGQLPDAHTPERTLGEWLD